MYQVQIRKRTFHFKQPAGTSRGVYLTRKSFFLSLSSEEKQGVVGIGECAPLPDLSCDAMPDEEYERILRENCDMFCQTGVIPIDAMRPYPSMLFGLETALAHWQANGSTALFDTPFSRGEQGVTINGLVWMGSFEEMYQRIEEKLQAGFHCVKLKIGAIDWQKEIELIRFIRQHFSSQQIELRVDANGGFSPEEAMTKLEQLAQYDIHSIEQPIRQHQWEEMAELCRVTPVPIALDEELIGVNDSIEKERLLDTICPQYIILKPSLHGGMCGSEEWITLARERGINSWVTSALESNIGLNAIAQWAAKVYMSRWDDGEEKLPQGLGTGQLFTDNIPLPLEIRGEQLWYDATSSNSVLNCF